MQEICHRCSLTQWVREPTREEYLLDLVLSDMHSLKIEVLPPIADHRLVLTHMKMRVPEVETRRREVWSFRNADWDGLKQSLREIEWHRHAQETEVDTCVRGVVQDIMECSQANIPTRTMVERKATHEWLTPQILEEVRKKHAAAGTADEKDAAERCSRTIVGEFGKFVQKKKEELRNAQRGSKSWWREARKLAHLSGPVHSTPALKSGDGWVKEAKGKADLFMTTFTAKYVVPPLAVNSYSAMPVLPHSHEHAEVSPEMALEVLSKLRPDSATGPDGLPARILKNMAAELAAPVAMITSKILEEGKWPADWRLHWIVALHKKLSVFDATNYRGIHLTPQLSKVVERLLAGLLKPFICRLDLFGENQFAYSQGRGARDAVAFLTLTWILAFDERRKVGVFCSDVQGAFDRVRKDRMVEKLESSGIPSKLSAVLASWLEDRKAQVVVEGQFSEDATLQDMVFQGTVLGPPLWNIFFHDASAPIQKEEFQEIVYADDLNAFREFDAAEENEVILDKCKQCQSSLHEWGSANAVTFDPGKESMHVLGRWDPSGDDFKILGILFDTRLRMEPCVLSTCTDASWKIGVILRTRRFHSTADLILLYKSQVLSYVEYRTPGIYHACSTLLDKLDRQQRRFLRELGLTEEEALLEHNLAPLHSRRDIAMLGLIHRTVLGEGPAHFRKFFRRHSGLAVEPVTRLAHRRHNKQLVDPRNGSHSELLARSAFGLIGVYNLLPCESVRECSVKVFQSCLQNLLKLRAKQGEDNWAFLYSPRQPLYSHPLLAV